MTTHFKASASTTRTPLYSSKVTVNEILTRNGYLPKITVIENLSSDEFFFDDFSSVIVEKPSNIKELGTLISNIASYGYTLSPKALLALTQITSIDLLVFWNTLEPILKKVKGTDKNISKYVVYKNFPQEVLDMDQAEYWYNQSLIYSGTNATWYTKEEAEKTNLKENLPLTVLDLSTNTTTSKILSSLLNSKAAWSTPEQTDAKVLLNNKISFDVNSVKFKLNLMDVLKFCSEQELDVCVKSPTDVLKLGATLSDSDSSLRTKVTFRKFKRSERRFLLNLIEQSTTSLEKIQEEFARNKECWKKFLYTLHPYDYKKSFPNTCASYDLLCKNKVKSFSSSVEQALVNKDKAIINTLTTRPGEFIRRYRKLVNTFSGVDVESSLLKVLPKLETIQLVKFKKFLETCNSNKSRIFPPRGNWSKLQIVANETSIPKSACNFALKHVKLQILSNLSQLYPNGFYTDSKEELKKIKLPTNDSDLSPYGRGTVLDIPDNINFIRTASYWETTNAGNIWYDNGWNFFDENFNSKFTCCWNSTNIPNKAAVFSGDPTSSQTGKACQLIDLYIDKLLEQGVRFAVWNILGYSHISFANSHLVSANLQWGEEPKKKKLLTPERSVLNFTLNGDYLSKYVAMLDLKKRKIIYLDANLPAQVHSAASNCAQLSSTLPALVEYLTTIPSLYDLFEDLPISKEGTPIYYSDKDVTLKQKEETEKSEISSSEKTEDLKAYVFHRVNPDNDFTQLSINDLY